MSDRRSRREERLIAQAFEALAQEEAEALDQALQSDPRLQTQADMSYLRHATIIRKLIDQKLRRRSPLLFRRYLPLAASIALVIWGGIQLGRQPRRDVTLAPVITEGLSTPTVQMISPVPTISPLPSAVPTDAPTPDPTATPTATPVPTPAPTVPPSATPTAVQSPAPTASPLPASTPLPWPGNYYPAQLPEGYDLEESSASADGSRAVFADDAGRRLVYTEHSATVISDAHPAGASYRYVKLQHQLMALVVEAQDGVSLIWDQDGQTLQVFSSEGEEAALRFANALRKQH